MLGRIEGSSTLRIVVARSCRARRRPRGRVGICASASRVAADDQRHRQQRHEQAGVEERLAVRALRRAGRGSRGSPPNDQQPKSASTMLGTPARFRSRTRPRGRATPGPVLRQPHPEGRSPRGAATAVPTRSRSTCRRSGPGSPRSGSGGARRPATSRTVPGAGSRSPSRTCTARSRPRSRTGRSPPSTASSRSCRPAATRDPSRGGARCGGTGVAARRGAAIRRRSRSASSAAWRPSRRTTASPPTPAARRRSHRSCGDRSRLAPDSWMIIGASGLHGLEEERQPVQRVGRERGPPATIASMTASPRARAVASTVAAAIAATPSAPRRARSCASG